MFKLTIFYIKNHKGELVYTNTNELEFADYVNKHMDLGLGKYPTFNEIQDSVKDLEIGTRTVTINV
ncbi:hypothetical protein PZN54_10975 [Staphylococcus capitis]|uniref:Uncharacterized protein n=1 Tax=Staphylococcus warneri TaxID=1292 RepID=A0A8B2ZD80_STAWA|nr:MULTISPECIES: hypothetical protein [Staphylococcus]MDH9600763.1 hypothetical protein [Staphylococcus capitis]MDH9624323.1 hypothetical protein [Staphylococcus capitis]RGM28297.1 hypothetical protein DXC19_11465 [Staphylococcus warneri]